MTREHDKERRALSAPAGSDTATKDAESPSGRKLKFRDVDARLVRRIEGKDAEKNRDNLLEAADALSDALKEPWPAAKVLDEILRQALQSEDDFNQAGAIDQKFTAKLFAKYVSSVLIEGAERQPGTADAFLDALLDEMPELSLLKDIQAPRSAGQMAALPDVAPEKWPGGRHTDETPPEFIGRVYAPWLGKGLDRAHVRKLDKPLWQALYNWLRHNEMPSDLDLPTRAEQNTRWVERLREEGGLPVSSETREYHRLHSAASRRRNPTQAER